MKADRAASEILGYVLIISIVVMIIGTVMTLGVGGLYNAQSAEQTANMERAFDVLADNIEQMYAGDAPSRATEIRLVDGHLAYGDPVSINVTIDGTLVGNRTIESNPIVYDNGDGTRLVYEAGAVIREDGDHSVMLGAPSFYFGENETVVPVVRTRALSDTAERMDGPATILIRTDGLRSQAYREAGTGEVNVTVTTDRTDAWDRYFSDLEIEGSSVNVADETVTLSFSSIDGEAILVRQRIRFTLQE